MSLVPLAKTQFTDANGVPLAMGTVAFYVPSTSTAKDTFQDAGLTVLNTNPVQLDAAGRAIIYGTGSYRQLVMDSIGNTVWDQAVTLNDAFLQSGASAVARTFEDKAREAVSVTDWGAFPTNVDCSAAVQRAFDEAPLGCDLIFPAPPTPDYTYWIGSPLTLSRKLNLVGPGARLIGHLGASTSPLLHINPTNTADLDARNWYIYGFREIAVYGGTGDAIRISDDGASIAQIGFTIEHCTIGGPDTGIGYAVRFDGVGVHLNNTIRDCQISGGIYLAGADGTTIEKNAIFGLKPGVTLNLIPGAYQTRIVDNEIVARDGALYVTQGDNWIFERNTCEQFPGYGANASTHQSQIALVGASGFPIRNAVIAKNNLGGGSNCAQPIKLVSYCSDIIIEKNQMRLGSSGNDVVISAATVKGTVIPSVENFATGARTSPDAGDALVVSDAGTATRGIWKDGSALTFANGWTAGSDFRRMVDEKGLVHLEGSFIVGSTTSGQTIVTLPEGYKPRNAIVLACANGLNDNNAKVQISSAGAVTIAGTMPTVGTSIYLTGISYRASVRDTYETGVV